MQSLGWQFNPPGRKSELSDMMPPNLLPKLLDLGISNRQSRCQQIATIPENEFDNHLQEIKLRKQGLTSEPVQNWLYHETGFRNIEDYTPL